MLGPMPGRARIDGHAADGITHGRCLRLRVVMMPAG
jgi:hypothetical protein